MMSYITKTLLLQQYEAMLLHKIEALNRAISTSFSGVSDQSHQHDADSAIK